jgi:hypothetical protein
MNDRTIELLKLTFGFVLNLAIIVLAALTGTGAVHIPMDVGHGILLTAIAKIDLDWAEWAFGKIREPDKK